MLLSQESKRPESPRVSQNPLGRSFTRWAEDVAALVFLIFLVQETREALEEARGDEDEDAKGGTVPH
jgi:hypothetical protein